ncbi:MAG: 5'-methylthioadenosine/adenosylhomocysteine nucleosidase [Treponemataceae bacterium]|nr:MAG: 5'-methylthioadenosine/adenosylhomocysteine nucleosidase [Treponemataceae bacterium]
MAEKKIGIIGAMDVEVAFLQNILSPSSPSSSLSSTKIAGITFYEGTLLGGKAVLAKCGVGKVNAGICVQILASVFGVTHIINTGIAGALDSSLRPCDIVVSTDALYHDVDAVAFGYPLGTVPGMQSVFPADDFLVKIAQKAFAALQAKADTKLTNKLLTGRIATGDVFVAEKSVKNKIIELFQPLCVEMEGAAIAHAATLNAIPFVIIRSISDMADEAGMGDYSFNEKTAAEVSAALVLEIFALL